MALKGLFFQKTDICLVWIKKKFYIAGSQGGQGEMLRVGVKTRSTSIATCFFLLILLKKKRR
jgi:hypothetical protein